MKAIIKTVSEFVSKNSTQILTGCALLSLVGATSSGIFATNKALKAMEDFRKEHLTDEDGTQYEMTKKEVFKVSYKYYIPTAVLVLTGGACIVGAQHINVRNSAILAGAYSLAEASAREYKQKVVEMVGENKERKMREEMTQKKIENLPPAEKRDVIITGRGEVDCYDCYSGRTFKHDIEKIRRAVNTINEHLLDEDTVPLNDFYYELGLDEIKSGRAVGWRVGVNKLEIHYSSHLDADKKPYLALDYDVMPLGLN